MASDIVRFRNGNGVRRITSGMSVKVVNFTDYVKNRQHEVREGSDIYERRERWNEIAKKSGLDPSLVTISIEGISIKGIGTFCLNDEPLKKNAFLWNCLLPREGKKLPSLEVGELLTGESQMIYELFQKQMLGEFLEHVMKLGNHDAPGASPYVLRKHNGIVQCFVILRNQSGQYVISIEDCPEDVNDFSARMMVK